MTKLETGGRSACNAGDQNTFNVGKGVGLDVFYPFETIYTRMDGSWNLVTSEQSQANEHCEHVLLLSL